MRIKKSKLLLISFLAAVISLFLLVSLVRGESITLQWDAVEGVDGYRVYQSIRALQDDGIWANEYDYSRPVTTVVHPAGDIPQETTELVVDLPGEADKQTRYRFVARAFRGDDMSVDSNEVEYKVNLVAPPAPAGLRGEYDKDAGIIRLSWTQPDDLYDYVIDYWILFYRLSGASEWTRLGKITADNELTLETAFDAVPAGQAADVEFTAVSYRNSGIFSVDSDLFTIHIDRTGGVVPPIDELRISVIIPVE